MPVVVLTGSQQRPVLVERPHALDQPDREPHVRREQDVGVDQWGVVDGRLVGELDGEDDAVPSGFHSARHHSVADLRQPCRKAGQPVTADATIVVGDGDERCPHLLEALVVAAAMPRWDEGRWRALRPSSRSSAIHAATSARRP
jgi:hypothetical protein